MDARALLLGWLSAPATEAEFDELYCLELGAFST